MKPFFRYCENCDHRNPANDLECEKCSADLSFVHPRPEKEEQENTGQGEKEAKNSDANPGGAPLGQGTGQGRQTVKMASLQLVSDLDGFTLSIPWEGARLGREGSVSPDYFEKHMYVSNMHAQILRQGIGYVLVDTDSTNGTTINGERCESRKEYPLKNGDRVVLANLGFVVKG